MKRCRRPLNSSLSLRVSLSIGGITCSVLHFNRAAARRRPSIDVKMDQNEKVSAQQCLPDRLCMGVRNSEMISFARFSFLFPFSSAQNAEEKRRAEKRESINSASKRGKFIASLRRVARSRVGGSRIVFSRCGNELVEVVLVSSALRARGNLFSCASPITSRREEIIYSSHYSHRRNINIRNRRSPHCT